MYEDIVRILYQLVNRQAISDEDKRKLEEWISLSAHNRRLYEEVLDAEAFRQEVKTSLDLDSKQLWKKISKRLPRKKNNLIAIFRDRPLRYAAAAAVLLIVSTGVYFLFFNKAAKEIASTEKKAQPSMNDIEPGREKATLTLADGSIIALDNTANGKIAEQGNAVILKEDGLLAYNSSNQKDQPGIFYNTVSTQRGGYYPSLVLADGTKVWLNASSSIHFPVTFTGKERIVEVTGEAYFEVAKDASKPFKVKINTPLGTRGEVQVLGTKFNINAYSDESVIKTTLLEGAVKISAGGKNSFLNPGQQAQLNTSGGIKLINEADLNATIAWKNGLLLFNHADIEEICRQISRWYDVEVVFENKIAGDFVITGIPRTVPLSKLLHLLELTNRVHFTIEGKKITVRS